MERQKWRTSEWVSERVKERRHGEREIRERITWGHEEKRGREERKRNCDIPITSDRCVSFDWPTLRAWRRSQRIRPVAETDLQLRNDRAQRGEVVLGGAWMSCRKEVSLLILSCDIRSLWLPTRRSDKMAHLHPLTLANHSFLQGLQAFRRTHTCQRTSTTLKDLWSKILSLTRSYKSLSLSNTQFTTMTFYRSEDSWKPG